MFTAAAVSTSVHLKSLCISRLVFCLCSDIMKFSSVMADIISLILKYLCFHVVILADIFFISACFSFFMILQLDITGDFMFLYVQKIFLAAIAAVCRNFFQNISKCIFMFLQDRDQSIIVCAVITYISL